MKVIVVGAGVGGTSAGIALQRLGHDVVIYDQMRENRPVGAALSLWSNGVKVLNWLGLGAEVAALGGDMADMVYLDGHTGETLCDFSLAPVTTQTGQKPYPVARADLQALLMERFGLDGIHLGKKLVGIADDGTTVTATFADGTTDTADMLIGADGARSIVRDYVQPEGAPPIEREYSGYTNVNGLVPVSASIGRPTAWTTYVADGKRAAVMPIAGDRFYFWFDIPSHRVCRMIPRQASHRCARRSATGRPECRSCSPRSTRPPRSTASRSGTSPRSTPGRRAASRSSGMPRTTPPRHRPGACSALEDAFALGIAFATNTLGVADTLRRYAAMRVERAGSSCCGRASAPGRRTRSIPP
jgi:FAD-dependent urate hydroxylase